MPLMTHILDEIQKDISSFADPGTPVVVTPNGHLSWMRGRRECSAVLCPSPGLWPVVRVDGREYDYESFLASDVLADLKDVAQSLCDTLAVPPGFIAGPARTPVEGEAHFKAGSAADLLLECSTRRTDLPLSATRVVFLHGDAGIGKSSVLVHAARRQAEQYVRGQTSVLFLYLDAQGKGLAQLDDVMARALQDLRARFTYHSVAALTRHHCIVPIVDGFDELIGPSSAREAFGNLAHFLGQLESSGVVVASSRSAFIDHDTLHERASEIARAQGLAYEISPIEVLPWGDAEIQRYCEEHGAGRAQLAQTVKSILAGPEAGLIRKPFYLSQVARIVQEEGNVSAEADLVGQIIEAGLTREAEKLKDRRGRRLLQVGQHRRFCEAISEEMWFQERAELDTETIRLVAEVIADEAGLQDQDRQTWLDRSIAHGLLVTAGQVGTERRCFEHEVFRFEFLAETIARMLSANASSLADLMARGELPAPVLDRVRRAYRPDGGKLAGHLVALSVASERLARSPWTPGNAGGIAAALLQGRQDLPEGLALRGMVIRRQALGEVVLRKAKLRQCVLERVDVHAARLLECEVTDCIFVLCRLGPRSDLSGTRLSLEAIGGLIWAETGGAELYNPDEIRGRLESVGAVVGDGDVHAAELTAEASSRVDLVERLLQHARGHFYLTEEDPWVRRNLSGNAVWPAVEGLLRKHGLLVDVQLQKSGRRETFSRLAVAPDTILQAWTRRDLAGERRIREFWEEVTAP